MMKSEIELIHQYAEKKRNGVSYSNIRKELYIMGIEKSAVDLLIKQIDEQILARDINSTTGLIRLEYRNLAWALILISIGSFAIFFYHYIFVSIIMFIPANGIIAGVTILFMMRGARNKRKKIFHVSRGRYGRRK